MEMFRPPAGLLATVFYRQNVARIVPSSTSSTENDLEVQGFARPTRKLSSPEEVRSRGGHSFAWKDLHLTLRKDGQERTLLQHIDGVSMTYLQILFSSPLYSDMRLNLGCIESGTLTALMGVSGAGKVCVFLSCSMWHKATHTISRPHSSMCWLNAWTLVS